MLEAPIEQECVDLAEADGWWVRKVGYIGRRGAPDRWLAKAGELLIVEFKRPGKKPDPHQVREHRRMREAGLVVVSIDSVESFKLLIGGANIRIARRGAA